MNGRPGKNGLKQKTEFRFKPEEWHLWLIKSNFVSNVTVNTTVYSYIVYVRNSPHS